MKRPAYIIKIIILGIALTLFSYNTIEITLADELEEQIQQKKEQLEKKESELSNVKAKADEITKTINGLAGNLNATQGQVNALQKQIADLGLDIENLGKKMDIKKQDLDEKNKVKDSVLRNVYIASQQNLLSMLFSKGSFAESNEEISYHYSLLRNSNSLIGLINKEIKGYESDKAEIEQIKEQVEKQKTELVAITKKIAAQVAAQKNSLSQISQQQAALQQEKNEIQKKLNELTAKQKEILDEKTETFTTSVGDIPSTGEASSRADYNPGFKPAFGAFSFGAPHRQGMSQYGAKGRAEEGQDFKEILKAYYGDVEVKEVDGIPSDIRTDKGTMSFEGKYLKGLAEMPASWPSEALKAQAVAGRTYALARTGWDTDNKSAGGSICTTESCQVWSSSKASSSSASRWHDAVNSTKGVILVSKKTGKIFSALYAATSGGYNYSYTSNGHSTSGGWDTSCGSRDCWTSKAYESKAGSPWFYKGWYKTRSGQACSRSHPWLTEKEFADIVGAVLLYKESSNNQKHLTQVDAQKCWGKSVDDTWSMDEVKEKSGVKEVNEVSVSYSSGGYTSEVKIKTNKGDHTFSGSDFKAVFNLRAPGAVQLKSLLYNIEVKK